jgi:cell division protein FtsW
MPLLGTFGLGALVLHMPERMGRLFAFWDPYKHRADEAFQPWQALIALGSGGASGLGLGMSRQKHSFLPEADTDFIFPILGEELGLWVALGVVIAFVVLTLASGWITVHAPDPAGVFLGIGLTTMISIQAIVNLMVVTSMMPTKGMPLPFISYGGSNLLACMSAVGILFNIARQGVCLSEKPEEQLLQQRCSLRM